MHALPGVPELLRALAELKDTVVIGLVTGNLEAIGRMKLEASGLAGPFTFGGFGSDHTDRGELIRLAVSRAVAAHPGLDPAACSVAHVGDTPHDLKAAATAAVQGVGVATGGFSADALLAVTGGPWTVLASLADTAAVLRVLGIAQS